MAKREDVTLGCTAKDTITGFKGIVIAITEWLNGCRRVTIQPQQLKDGKPIDCQTIDIEQVEGVEACTWRGEVSHWRAEAGTEPAAGPDAVAAAALGNTKEPHDED